MPLVFYQEPCKNNTPEREQSDEKVKEYWLNKVDLSNLNRMREWFAREQLEWEITPDEVEKVRVLKHFLFFLLKIQMEYSKNETWLQIFEKNTKALVLREPEKLPLDKPYLILNGPAGCGKTILLHEKIAHTIHNDMKP